MAPLVRCMPADFLAMHGRYAVRKAVSRTDHAYNAMQNIGDPPPLARKSKTDIQNASMSIVSP